MLTLWPCFICGKVEVCEHREREIVIWIANGYRDGVASERLRYLEGLRAPVRSETASRRVA